MTKWGKFLRVLGRVPSDELEWILRRVLDLKAERRNWGTRFKIECEAGTFDNVTDLWAEELRTKFSRTRLAKIHGWQLSAGCKEVSTPQFLHVRVCSPTVDVVHLMRLWVYDVGAFLKACDGKGGLNMDEAQWMLEHICSKVEKKHK